MYQTVNTAIQTDEDTEIGNGFDFAADFVTFVMGSAKLIPWV